MYKPYAFGSGHATRKEREQRERNQRREEYQQSPEAIREEQIQRVVGNLEIVDRMQAAQGRPNAHQMAALKQGLIGMLRRARQLTSTNNERLSKTEYLAIFTEAIERVAKQIASLPGFFGSSIQEPAAALCRLEVSEQPYGYELNELRPEILREDVPMQDEMIKTLTKEDLLEGNLDSMSDHPREGFRHAMLGMSFGYGMNENEKGQMLKSVVDKFPGHTADLARLLIKLGHATLVLEQPEIFTPDIININDVALLAADTDTSAVPFFLNGTRTSEGEKGYPVQSLGIDVVRVLLSRPWGVSIVSDITDRLDDVFSGVKSSDFAELLLSRSNNDLAPIAATMPATLHLDRLPNDLRTKLLARFDAIPGIARMRGAMAAFT